MRKGTDIVGRTIVSFETGRRVARVADLIFDQDGNQLLGLLTQEAGMFRSARVVPLSEVQAIGADAIIVKSDSSIMPGQDVPKIYDVLRHSVTLRGTRILTTDGMDLGTLVDLFFDDRTGEIEGYEVSGGLFADAYSGRAFVPAPQTLKIGDDIAFVPPEIAQMMQEQVGGIKGAVQTAGGRLQESAEVASLKLQSSTEAANDRMRVAGQSASEQLQEAGQAANERFSIASEAISGKLQNFNRDAGASLTNHLVNPLEQKAFVIGKMVNQDIVAPDGLVLLVKGQEVTAFGADEAERLGILDQVYRAADGSLTASTSRDLKQSAGRIGDHIQTASQNAATNVRQSIDQLAARSTLDQAYGHRVQQAVRTEEGVVIAVTGQIVTDRVLEKARIYSREADLLSAVGLTPVGVVRTRADSALSTASGEFRDRTALAQENFGTFWQNLQEKVADLQGRGAQAVKQQRIEHALGRPVTRVILDPEDNVILNVGELITHRAIRAAEIGGVLNILLSSVYSKEPAITEKELRAPEPGIAALEYDGHTNGHSPVATQSVEIN